MEITIYSQTGDVLEKVSVPPEIFEVKRNETLVHRALVMQLANQRRPIAHTKTRSERAGSTKKLYRQKGTGQARQGPGRSPIHRKGGVAHGPRNTRNFEKSMNKKERRKALFTALSSKAQEAGILGLDKYEGKINTKAFAGALKKLPLGKKTLLVLSEKNPILQKSSNNIPYVKSILVNYLNVRDILSYDHVVFLKDALLKLPSIFLASHK